ncbi:MAG: peroxidase-related enzyme [Myxococcota bacterium]
MPQADRIMALDLPSDEAALPEQLRAYFDKCREKLGLVPNVLKAYVHNPRKLSGFITFYNELMLGESELTKLEREMVAVVVSSTNHCYYCLVAHGQAVRALADDPQLGEMLAMNYRVAELEPRHRTMLAFAWKLTKHPDLITDDDRAALREAGFSESAIFDLAEVAGFFNMSNRVAAAVDMMPNPEYHAMNRG